MSFHLVYFSFYILKKVDIFLYSHSAIITPNKINNHSLVLFNNQFIFKLSHLPKTNSFRDICSNQDP